MLFYTTLVDCCDCLSHDEWTTSTTSSHTLFWAFVLGEPSNILNSLGMKLEEQMLMIVLIHLTLEQVVLSNLKSNATTQVILERCAMYLDSDTLGHDLSSCDMVNEHS